MIKRVIVLGENIIGIVKVNQYQTRPGQPFPCYDLGTQEKYQAMVLDKKGKPLIVLYGTALLQNSAIVSTKRYYDTYAEAEQWLNEFYGNDHWYQLNTETGELMELQYA